MAMAMLSLVSNPYNPFEDYESWKNYDSMMGFDTNGFLSRLVDADSELPDPVIEQMIEDAIDSVLQNTAFHGLYKKVVRDAP